MADEDQAEQEPAPATQTTPSLTAPSLGLGRLRRGRSRAAEPETAPELAPDAAPDLAPTVLLESPAAEPEPQPEPAALFDEDDAAGATPSRRRFALPEMKLPEIEVPTRVAAMLVGVLVGLVVVALTYGGLHLCTLLQGTSSCGGPGFFLLLAIMIAAVTVGSLLLKLARIGDATSTSVMGVGLMLVVALLVLENDLTDWWMVIAIPLITLVTFTVSQYLTESFGDARVS